MEHTDTTLPGLHQDLQQVVVGISHELNNPNAFIRLNAANLKKLFWFLRPCLEEYGVNHPGGKLGPFTVTEIQARINGALDSILDASVRIITVADKLKQLSTHPLEEFTRISMAEVVREELEHHRFYLEKVTRLAVEIPPEEDFPVKGHKLQLGQAFSTLVINGADAIQEKYGEEGPEKGLLRVTLSAGEGRVRIRVSDNGTGMSEETLKKIRTPYFSTKPQGKGDGLGIPICESILKRHGGELVIESEEGSGTEALMDLPRWED